MKKLMLFAGAALAIASPGAGATLTDSIRADRMRPKKPDSLTLRSLKKPGRKTLSCTEAALRLAALAARTISIASSVELAIGFSR